MTFRVICWPDGFGQTQPARPYPPFPAISGVSLVAIGRVGGQAPLARPSPRCQSQSCRAASRGWKFGEPVSVKLAARRRHRSSNDRRDMGDGPRDGNIIVSMLLSGAPFAGDQPQNQGRLGLRAIAARNLPNPSASTSAPIQCQKDRLDRPHRRPHIRPWQ